MKASKKVMARRQRSLKRYEKILKRRALKLWGKPFAKQLANRY